MWLTVPWPRTQGCGAEGSGEEGLHGPHKGAEACVSHGSALLRCRSKPVGGMTSSEVITSFSGLSVACSAALGAGRGSAQLNTHRVPGARPAPGPHPSRRTRNRSPRFFQVWICFSCCRTSVSPSSMDTAASPPLPWTPPPWCPAGVLILGQ